MATPLTIKQMLSIATLSSEPPWRASALKKNWGTAGQPLSLVSATKRFEATTTAFYAEIRDASILSSSPTLAALQSNLASPNSAWVPTRQGLVQLFQTLNSNGIAVKGLSADWQTIAISGPAAAFAAIPVTKIATLATSAPAASGSGGVKPLVDPVSNDSGDNLIKVGGIMMTLGKLVPGSVTGTGAGEVAFTGPAALGGYALAGGAVLVGLGLGVLGGNGLYTLSMPQSAQSLNPCYGYVGPDGNFVLIPTWWSMGPNRTLQLQIGQIVSAPPTSPTDIPSGPPSPPQSDDSQSPPNFATGIESKQDKEVTDKDKDGVKESKEGKEVTDNKDKDGTKESKDGKEVTDVKDKEGVKDEKEGTDKLKEDKDGKDSKDDKEVEKDKDGKEQTDSGGFGDDIREGGATAGTKADAVGATETPSPATGGNAKPASLLTRSPLV